MKPHDRFNFNLRPAKRIERRLIAEGLACIYRYADPRQYTYVGMGSYYFTDFSLLHKNFGIDAMVSIESDTTNEKRFEFNKPFNCIEMQFGTTHVELPKLAKRLSDQCSICWLDYYDVLGEPQLGDITTYVTAAKEGSVLLVTFAAEAKTAAEISHSFAKLPEVFRTDENKKRLGIPDGLIGLYLQISEARVMATAASRGNLKVRRVFQLAYQDGAQMCTFGWLLLSEGQANLLDAEPKFKHDLAASAAQLTKIKTPALTFREIAHLRANLPLNQDEYIAKRGPIPEVAATEFAKYYRYFPQFADTEE